MLRVRHLTAPDQLRAVAAQWDDLWVHSDATDPTGKAGLLAAWLERFGRNSDTCIVVVESEASGQFLVGLPLMGRTIRRVLRAGCLPGNAWYCGADLLVRADPQAESAVQRLVEALRELPWSLLSLERCHIDNGGWKLFLQGMGETNSRFSIRPQEPVGLIDLQGPWEAFLGRLRGSVRQNLRRRSQKFAEIGGIARLDWESSENCDLGRCLSEMFQVEDRSWKGSGGSSVLRRGVADFYLDQAAELARQGHLSLHYLEVNGAMISFQFGAVAKGVFHSYKIGYDPEYKSLGPGQLLRFKLLERLIGQNRCTQFDCVGELTGATLDWVPGSYRVGQVFAAPRGLWSRLAVQGHARWWPALARAWRRPKTSPSST